MHVLELLLGKPVFGMLTQAIHGTAKVIAGITYGLQFGYLAHHALYLSFGIAGKASLTHHVQIIGNLQFHAICDVLILFNAGEEFVEVIPILGFKQFLDQREHALATCGKKIDFFTSLKDAEFGSAQQTTANVLETPFLHFVLSFLLRNEHAYKFLHRLDEPNKDKHITHIE